jgi:hypothetical protein
LTVLLYLLLGGGIASAGWVWFLRQQSPTPGTAGTAAIHRSAELPSSQAAVATSVAPSIESAAVPARPVSTDRPISPPVQGLTHNQSEPAATANQPENIFPTLISEPAESPAFRHTSLLPEQLSMLLIVVISERKKESPALAASNLLTYPTPNRPVLSAYADLLVGMRAPVEGASAVMQVAMPFGKKLSLATGLGIAYRQIAAARQAFPDVTDTLTGAVRYNASTPVNLWSNGQTDFSNSYYHQLLSLEIPMLIHYQISPRWSLNSGLTGSYTFKTRLAEGNSSLLFGLSNQNRDANFPDLEPNGLGTSNLLAENFKSALSTNIRAWNLHLSAGARYRVSPAFSLGLNYQRSMLPLYLQGSSSFHPDHLVLRGAIEF